MTFDVILLIAALVGVLVFMLAMDATIRGLKKEVLELRKSNRSYQRAFEELKEENHHLSRKLSYSEKGIFRIDFEV